MGELGLLDGDLYRQNLVTGHLWGELGLLDGDLYRQNLVTGHLWGGIGTAWW